METDERWAAVWSTDRAAQNAAYESLMAETAQPVAWADEVWDSLVGHLSDGDNHNRAIAAQLLCSLAAHDTGGRAVADLGALVLLTRDERFVTARHTLRSLWRIGLGGPEQRRAVVAALARRCRDSAAEKNGTLIRSDIIESLRRLHDAVDDPAVEATAGS